MHKNILKSEKLDKYAAIESNYTKPNWATRN